MRYVYILAFLFALGHAESGLAEQQVRGSASAGRSEVDLERKSLVADSLNLTSAEALRFWPMYERFQRDLAAWKKRREAVIAQFGENYDNMTDEAAIKLTIDRLELEEDRSRLMRKYLPEFRRVLPAKKVARYYDVEAKIRAAVNAEIAEGIPLPR